jgi:hypothetical protein
MRVRENPNMMDFQAFLSACETLAERLVEGEALVDKMNRIVEIMARQID